LSDPDVLPTQKPTTLEEAIRIRVLELSSEVFNSRHIPEFSAILCVANDPQESAKRLQKFYPNLTHDILIAEAQKML